MSELLQNDYETLESVDRSVRLIALLVTESCGLLRLLMHILCLMSVLVSCWNVT
jgi:hypothetical protein